MRRVFAVALLAALPLGAQEWYFRTLAGTATGGGTADGAAATARFSSPSGVAVCADAIYIADAGNHAIRRLSRDGVVTTFAGALAQAGSANGTRETARFRYPSGISADSQCNLVVADRGNHTIRRISAAGLVTTVAGSTGLAGLTDGNGSAARFQRPQDVALDADGTIWVVDTGNNRVRRITPAGSVQTINRTFNLPLGVTLDAAGSAYVADHVNHAVVRITRDGVSAPVAGGPSLFLSDVAFDGSGNLYITNYSDQLLQRSSGGTLTTVAGTKSRTGSRDGQGTEAMFDFPRAVAFDPADGSFVIIDEFAGTIRRVTADGLVTTIAGTAAAASAHVDGVGTAARFLQPGDVDVDADGVAYVSDFTTIRRIARDGATTTIAGTPGESLHRDGSRGEARFRGAGGIALEPSGSLVVVDGDTIRRVTLAGEVTTIAGSPTESGYRDEAGASARFNYIVSIAVAPGGTIYAADAFNRAIRKISGNVVTTLAKGDDFAPPIGGMDVGPDGNLYLWNENVPSVFRITPAGVVTKVASDPSLNTHVNGLAVAPDGTIYLGGFRYHTIFRIVPGSSTIERWAGDDFAIGNQNGTRAQVRFRSPSRLDVAPDGRIFIRDGNRAIRVASSQPEPSGPRRRSVRK